MTTTPSAAGTLLAYDAEGLIAADLPCIGCGYLLRKQPPDGRCPECDTAVVDSISASNILLADRHWLGQVQAGAVCLAVGMPLVPIFGLGLLAWAIGVIALSVDAPKHIKALRRLGTLAIISGLLVIGGVGAVFVMFQTVNKFTPLLIAQGALLLMFGLHVGAVMRMGVVVSREAQWRAMARIASASSWFAWAWPFLVGASVVLMGLAVNYTLGHAAAIPWWFEIIAAVVWYGTFFGSLLFAVVMFVFWIVLAVSMRRLRHEALSIFHEAQEFADQGRQV